MVMFYSPRHGVSFCPTSDIGRPDGNSEVEISHKNHNFKPVILGGRHGWECVDCGYKELAMFFGTTPPCPGKKPEDK